jgi:hypothetical protein
MKAKKRCAIYFLLLPFIFPAQSQQTPFEISGGKESATYDQVIRWYKDLGRKSKRIKIIEKGPTDAGEPLHLAMISADGQFNPKEWHRQKKVVLLVINGIHAGEPDGIDASMMLARDWALQKGLLPQNVAVALLPVYNIGGCLNRGTYSRVNQNGPAEYGFRANAQYLDLNRDFTKCDSREAASFSQIFQWVDPDILIDNHVSDGADYPYTMTLLTTQYEKLGPVLGDWLKKVFEPRLYALMKKQGEEIFPYVNFNAAGPGKEMQMFYDPPRFSSGYAALFQTMAFVPETHMLKPFADRVLATKKLISTLTNLASNSAETLIRKRNEAKDFVQRQTRFPLAWKPDSSLQTSLLFRGYAQVTRTSKATGLPQTGFDRLHPYEQTISYYNTFKPALVVDAPLYYAVSGGWQKVIERLRWNGVKMRCLKKDSSVRAEVYRIETFKSYAEPYEGHHNNYGTAVASDTLMILLRKGDYIIDTRQPARRYLLEMLEPSGDDSFFAWNFFDAVLQQKEGYSDYRWDELAGGLLEKDSALQRKLIEQRRKDPAFAENAPAQLEFLYRNSPYFEAGYRRYPVYRLLR